MKSNISILGLTALLSGLLCCASLQAQTGWKANKKIGLRPVAASANGKYYTGFYEATESTFIAYLWNWESDEYTELSESYDPSAGNAVTNDGTVFGSYQKRPAYYKDGQWQPLPLPSKTSSQSIGEVLGVNAIGSVAVGYIEGPGNDDIPYEVYPVRWRKEGNLYVIDSFPYVKGPKRTTTGYALVMPYGVSNDGNRISGWFSEDGDPRKLIIWDPLWNTSYDSILRKGPGRSQYYLTPNPVCLSYDGKYQYGAIEDLSSFPANIIPYIFDLDKKELTEGPKGLDITAISGDYAFAYTPFGAPLTLRTGIVWDRSINKTIMVEDFFVEKYQCNYLRDNFSRSGTPLAVSEDGKTIAGWGADIASGQLCTWVIKVGEEIPAPPSPTDLKVENLDNNSGNINWKAPEGESSNIAGYNVYRNNAKINSNLVNATNYLDEDLPRRNNIIIIGDYCYQVEAVYKNDYISSKTESACMKIDAIGLCAEPTKLSAKMANDGNSSVALQWEIPNFIHRYDKGVNYNWGYEFGTESLPFFYGVKFDSLNELHGMKYEEVSFFPRGEGEYVFHLYIDGVLTEKKAIEYPEIGKFNTFALDNKITIDKNKTYIFSFLCKNYTETPAGYDQSCQTIPGYSDLFSILNNNEETPKEFVSAFETGHGSFFGAFNIGVSVNTNREGASIVTPVPGKPSPFDASIKNYSIFRDGNEIGKAYKNAYIDSKFPSTDKEAKDYTYTVVANYFYECSSEASEALIFNRTIAIEENPELAGKIFPNPVTNGTLQLELKAENILLFDLVGKKLLNAENFAKQIDLSSLKAGVYILHLQINGKNYTQKIILQ